MSKQAKHKRWRDNVAGIVGSKSELVKRLDAQRRKVDKRIRSQTSGEGKPCGNCPYCTRASCPNYKAHPLD